MNEEFYEEYDTDDIDSETPYETLVSSAKRVMKEYGFTAEEAAESYGVKIEDLLGE